MVTRLRSRWLAGGAALLLVMSLSGMAAAATLVSDTTDPLVTPGDPATVTTDTTQTFEDLDGNGVDDDCQAVAPTTLPDVAAAAFAAVDLDGNGTISTSEAAQSDWIGGTNCNHGGYVSGVAGASGGCDQADAPEAAETSDGTKGEADQAQGQDGQGQDENDAAAGTTTVTSPTDCSTDTPTTGTDSAAKDAARAACEAALAAGTPIVLAPMTHVQLAQSDVVGGKNCNHGGAVSDANKAAKAERDAAKLAAKQAREAAKALKSHGHKHGGH